MLRTHLCYITHAHGRFSASCHRFQSCSLANTTLFCIECFISCPDSWSSHWSCASYIPPLEKVFIGSLYHTLHHLHYSYKYVHRNGTFENRTFRPPFFPKACLASYNATLARSPTKVFFIQHSTEQVTRAASASSISEQSETHFSILQESAAANSRCRKPIAIAMRN